MSLEGLARGYYGRVVVVEVQEDGAGVDVSEFTTLMVVLRPPSGTVKEKTAAFESDGTDGRLIFTPVSDDFDEVGEWLLQVQLTKVVGEVTTQFVPSSVVAFTVGTVL